MSALQTPMDAGRRYNAVAMSLHWLIALLILGNIGLAWWFNGLPLVPEGPDPTPGALTAHWTTHGLFPTAARSGIVQLHKSIGITVLILSLARLAWRFAKPPPALPASVTRWERLAAGAVYVLFYGIMIGMPLSGWAMVSASKLIHVYPIRLFGVVPWPAIAPLTHLPPDQMHQAHETFGQVHEYLAYLAYALVLLHVAAALRHLLWLRDGVMGRMVPFARAPSLPNQRAAEAPSAAGSAGPWGEGR